MNQAPGSINPAHVRERVKRNARQMLLPAVIVLFVGWFMFKPPLKAPSGLAETVVTVMIWVLRVGGIALIGAAFLCWMGHIAGMVLDAILSTSIAAALTAATLVHVPVLWSGGFDLVVLIFAVFAAVYIRASVALWQDLHQLRRGVRSVGMTGSQHEEAAETSRDAPPAPASTTPATPRTPSLEPNEAAQSEYAESAEAPEPERRGLDPNEEAPDGFLADFGEERRTDTPGRQP